MPLINDEPESWLRRMTLLATIKCGENGKSFLLLFQAFRFGYSIRSALCCQPPPRQGHVAKERVEERGVWLEVGVEGGGVAVAHGSSQPRSSQ